MFWMLCVLFILICIMDYYKERKLTIALIYSLEWAFLAIMVCFFDLPRDELAFFFILINSAVFSFSHLFFNSRLNIQYGEINEYELIEREDKFYKINRIIIVINLLAVLYLAYTLGFSISSFRSLNSLMIKMNAISHARYSEDAEYLPVINRLVNAIVYATCGYNGFFMAKKWKFANLPNIIIVLFQTILTNTKATLIFGIAFWAGGYLTGFHFFDKKMTKKKIIGFLGVALGLILFSATINYLRHKGDTAFSEEIVEIFVRYFIGPFSAFSLWFSSGIKNTFDFGANTFACIFRLLGIREQTHGDFVVIKGMTTNVYTIFKHLINDYSYVGTVLVSAIVGFISTVVDRSLGTKRFKAVGWSIAINATLLVAFFSSMFRYTTNLLAALIIICATLPIKFKVRR